MNEFLKYKSEILATGKKATPEPVKVDSSYGYGGGQPHGQPAVSSSYGYGGYHYGGGPSGPSSAPAPPPPPPPEDVPMPPDRVVKLHIRAYPGKFRKMKFLPNLKIENKNGNLLKMSYENIYIIVKEL